MGLAASWNGPSKLEKPLPALFRGMEPAATVLFCQLGRSHPWLISLLETDVGFTFSQPPSLTSPVAASKEPKRERKL